MTLNKAQFAFTGNRFLQPSIFFLLFLVSLAFSSTARAQIFFEVYLGYDGVVPEASWFPVACEIRNDGPTFNAIFEISSGRLGSSEVRRVPVELPTNTRKRIVVPVFSTARNANWTLRLLDHRGNIRAERLNVRPRRQTRWETPLLGALARTVNGVPSLPDVKSNRQDKQPASARLNKEFFPDHPIALEGLDTIYINSQSALDMNVAQYSALLSWLHGGGHLIVNVEQVSDVSGSSWLGGILPADLSGTKSIETGTELESWLKQKVVSARSTNQTTLANSKTSKVASGENPFETLETDATFSEKESLVFTGKILDGTILISVADTPLAIQAQRGRGRVTLLTFNAEREPFVSWKNRPWFWAKISDIPAELYQSSDFNYYGGTSIDSAFGAMIDSKQVRKLPLTWLLLLLVVYLLVIGPLDQFWLKKINRQMLTWLTFPAYVLLFSALIYFIGFKLRAGDSEYNELHVVDILPRGEDAILRGRTFASIYSPSNARYPFAGAQTFAALRSEFSYGYSGAERNGNASIIHQGNTFVAEVSVPVWTSQLFVNHWMDRAETPLKFSIVPSAKGWDLTIENRLERKLTEAHVVLNGRIISIGELPASQISKKKVGKDDGSSIRDFLRQIDNQLWIATQQRRYTFGNIERIELNLPLSAIAASFGSKLERLEHEFFVSPAGFDLSSYAEQGSAILLAWDAGNVFTEPLNKFSSRRSQRDTLLRLVVPQNKSTSN